MFINDGSRDRSAALLREQFQRRPDVTRVVLFSGNFGQHMAIMAGFEHCRGSRVVTLDADLQNPPEEIGKLLAAMDRGHDYVGSIRRNAPGFCVPPPGVARDELACASASRGSSMTDQGCMLRAYDRDIVDAIESSARGQHVHSGARLHLRRAIRPRSRSRTRSAPPANRSIRCTS